MNMNVEQLLGKVLDSFSEFDYIRTGDIPTIDLYMDQVTTFMDSKLKMYKLNASLADLPYEVGRARAFPAGWLENESIWLHMEYKYLLALLECEMYDQFFVDFHNTATTSQ